MEVLGCISPCDQQLVAVQRQPAHAPHQCSALPLHTAAKHKSLCGTAKMQSECNQPLHVQHCIVCVQ